MDLEHVGHGLETVDDRVELRLLQGQRDERLHPHADVGQVEPGYEALEDPSLLQPRHPGLDRIARDTQRLGQLDDAYARIAGERRQQFSVETVDVEHYDVPSH